jgi:hypothetical protein
MPCQILFQQFGNELFEHPPRDLLQGQITKLRQDVKAETLIESFLGRFAVCLAIFTLKLPIVGFEAELCFGLPFGSSESQNRGIICLIHQTKIDDN